MQGQSKIEYVRNRINILMKLGREDQVLKEYDEIIRLTGENDEIRFKKAVLLFRMKRMKEAAEECDRAISINSSVPIYHYGKALALNVLEDYPGSLKEINEVLRLVSSPQRESVYETPSRNINLEIERLLKHFEEIESHEVPEHNIETFAEGAEEKEEPVRKEEFFEPQARNKISVRDQSFLDPDFTESIDDLKKLDKALKDIDIHFNRLKSAAQSVDLAIDEKEGRLKRLLASCTDPQIEEILRGYSDVLRVDINGEDRRNLRKIERVLDSNPKNGELHYGKALFLYTRGDFDEAMAEMEIARNLDPVSSAYNFGITLIENKSMDYEQSIKNLTNQARESPDNPSVHYKRGMMLYLLKRFGEAADEFNNAIDLYQYDPRYYFGRTLARYMLDSVA
ncbi:hypothetical protein IX51_09785 [uncultured archaeon]|nr:hypothetical protein IX51_09785 [uncultured archaeon]